MSVPAAATAVAIDVREVSMGFQVPRRRERYWALKDVSLEIREGETLGLIGRNGAGKTTLLQLLADIITPTLGKIRRHVDRVSMLSLNAGLQPNLSGRDNAILNGLLLGLPLAEIKRRLEQIKQFAGLGEFFEMPVSTYSTGMRARLGFATAHLADPDVLLVDEVLAVGDRDFRAKAMAVMEAHARSDSTIVLVSHSPGLVARLCDRVAWIEHGRLVAIGAPADILDRYQHAHEP